MVPTYGLRHINLVVRDSARSLRFCGHMFGVREYSRGGRLVHATTPGCHDVITFDEQKSDTSPGEGVVHFGFRLMSPTDIHAAVEQVGEAGGKLLRRDEFAPGLALCVRRRPGWLRS
jgi:predicted enzyme related to lactoylglutathione lyase